MCLQSQILDGIEDAAPAAAGGNSVRELRPVARARPTRSDAEAAVRTLILWAGDDPALSGLIEFS